MARRRNSFGSVTPFSASVIMHFARVSLRRSSCRNFGRRLFGGRSLGPMTVQTASNTRTSSDGGYGFPLWVMVEAPRICRQHALARDPTTGQNGVDALTRFGKRFVPRWTHYSEAREAHDRKIGSPWPNSEKPGVVVAFAFDPIAAIVSSTSFHLAPLAPRLKR
jgi:hypothetical protein